MEAQKDHVAVDYRDDAAKYLQSEIVRIKEIAQADGLSEYWTTQLVVMLEEILHSLQTSLVDSRSACRAVFQLHDKVIRNLSGVSVAGPLRSLGFNFGEAAGLTEDEVWDIMSECANS